MLQNLALSGLIIAVLIPVAAAGWLGLGAVVAVHEVAEIVVIVNGLRARRSLSADPHHDHTAHPSSSMPDRTRQHLGTVVEDSTCATRSARRGLRRGRDDPRRARVPDRAHSRHGPLCAVRHHARRLRRRADFDDACRALAVPLELRHRDEIDEAVKAAAAGRYPCIVGIGAAGASVVMDRDDVDACAGDPDTLVERLNAVL